MQHWGDCISYRRYGYQTSGSPSMRSEFTRDYDRIIFLSAFRRLQNKTQVFPLPGNVFVHNRLTHSLEVASVGRSLGSLVGQALLELHAKNFTDDQRAFYTYELSGVVASACLAHDLGNPAFGHSGEKAISHYFETNAEKILNGSSLKSHFSQDEWSDITNFEGNANALRLLTRQFRGKLEGGQRLMFVTLASILKYPCASSQIDKTLMHQKKYGYFLSDKTAFDDVMQEFGLTDEQGYAHRHPFVYLVEAADDICYRIIDLEDAHRIGIISRDATEHYFLSLLTDLDDNVARTKEVLAKISDNNEAISYLRAKCINGLVMSAASVFAQYSESILAGKFNSTLLDEVEKTCPFLDEINKISIKKIYNHPSVIEVELAGYNVMSEILSVFVDAVLNTKRTPLQKKCLHLIPEQYNYANENVSAYEKTMSVLDFVSGMTDGYATEMYRKMKGIDIPSHK
ncbi:MAG: dNTP triphosphohydrolase [Saprospiraceae bacterium]|nr:dNTP triphosphohydrolase [Saprospiraceae bacterium]